MTDKKNILLQPRHLVREKEPRMEDFKLNSSFSNMPIKVYDETAYQKAMDEFKERNPEEPDYDWVSFEDKTPDISQHIYYDINDSNIIANVRVYNGTFLVNQFRRSSNWCDKAEHDAKVKAYEESRIFYEGFQGEDGCYHNNVVMAVFGTGGGFGIEFINTPDKHYLENGISLYLWEAITGLKPKEA